MWYNSSSTSSGIGRSEVYLFSGSAPQRSAAPILGKRVRGSSVYLFCVHIFWLPLIWLLTWCKSAPLFSNCPDFLQIEIYYIKKRKFLEQYSWIENFQSSFGCLLDVNLHHFSVTVPTSYRLKFTIIRSIYFWLSLDFWILDLKFLSLD